MLKNEDLNDLGPDKVVTVTMLRSEFDQLEMMMEKVERHANRSTYWAQFRGFIDNMRERFKQVPRSKPEELRPAHWINFFTSPSGNMEKP